MKIESEWLIFEESSLISFSTLCKVNEYLFFSASLREHPYALAYILKPSTPAILSFYFYSFFLQLLPGFPNLEYTT